MALSREIILDTAYDLLTQYGLADLSMRRLATELGVAPGALYYHVKNKQELLASLASRMVAHPNFEGSEPRTALLHGCQEVFVQLSQVRESAEVIRMALVIRPDELAFIAGARQLFAQLGVPSLSQEDAARSLLHLCISLVEEEQTRALLTANHLAPESSASYRRTIAALIDGWASASSLEQDDRV